MFIDFFVDLFISSLSATQADSQTLCINSTRFVLVSRGVHTQFEVDLSDSSRSALPSRTCRPVLDARLARSIRYNG